MQCISCGIALNNNSSGFIICPNCQTVNIANSTDQSKHTESSPKIFVAADPAEISPAVSHRAKKTRLANLKHFHPPNKLILVLSSASILVGLVLILVTYLLLQNARANSLLSQAKSDITTGKYTSAAPLLNTALGIFSLSSTHQKIIELNSQNKI